MCVECTKKRKESDDLIQQVCDASNTVQSFTDRFAKEEEKLQDDFRTGRRGTNLGGWMCVTLARVLLVKEAIKDGYK